MTGITLRARIEQLASEANRGCGLSYELYVRRFSGAFDGFLESIDEGLREEACQIAREHDYSAADELDDFDLGTCTLTGIEAECCPCGRHP